MPSIPPRFYAGGAGGSRLRKKILITALIVILCYDSVWLGKKLLPKFSPVKIDAKYENRSKGDLKGELWVIEYLDFQCKACRMAFGMMEESLRVRPKDIYLQVRHYPLTHSHRYALKSALYAECASRQGRFWEFSKALFAAQEEWSSSQDPDAVLERLAAPSGVELGLLKACVEDPAVKESILAEKEEGKSLGIKMTPTFFMNGKKVEGLDAAILEMENFIASKESKKSP